MMAQDKKAAPARAQRPSRPFEQDLSLEVSDRATRLAMALFGEVGAHVALVEDGVAWRSHAGGVIEAPGEGVRWVLQTGEALWIEDASRDPHFSQGPAVIGPPHIRFYAAQPIRLNDGRIAGVLAVFAPQPRVRDEAMLARLADLASFIADEWDRNSAARESEVHRRKSQAAEAVFNAVIRSIPASVVVTDRDFRVIDCSPIWARGIGRTPDEVIGAVIADVHPDAVARWGPLFEEVRAGRSISAEKVQHTSLDGAPAWMTVEMAPWHDADGEIGGMVCATHDITSLVESLERAERSEQRLTLAMELAGLHVWEMDYSRRELIKVGSEADFFDAPMTYEALEQDIYRTIDARDLPSVHAAWLRHEQTGEPYCAEYRVARSDDKEIWVTSRCQVVLNRRGNPSRLIGAIQSITERKRSERTLLQAKEEAEVANQAKSAFLATMSHEIRTPLNGVLGMAQAMAADPLSDSQRERLEVIRHSGETLLTILNDILDLSKIEAGKLELEEVEFDLGELARGAHATFAAIAAGKDLAFDLAIDPDAEGLYRGDSTRVRQIVGNLVSNAVKFTTKGSVTLAVKAVGGGLEFRVSDTGIGIPADRLPRLFRKFEQADASTTRRFGGTGLGLAICRELAERLGGDIRAESVEGRGTTFIVRLPLVRVGAARPAAPPCKTEALADVEELRVLAAEDNPVNKLVLKTLLNQAGIEPTIVDDGAEAVAAYQTQDWDLVLMDVQMPVMDGPGATRIIRELERSQGRPRTPIIALTANAMAHQILDYTAAGMDGYVSKPIDVEQLFAAMQKALDPCETPQDVGAAA